jgi:hypothetical protein
MRRGVDRFRALVEPATTGLPNWRVVTWFPVLAFVGALVLVVLHISGTSSGVEWYSLGNGVDPNLILGSPRAIRSDEWLVQQSWVVSQAQHGFGDINPTLPGGIDMAVLNELPSWDWSSIFRPHLWGYLFLGLNAGIAWFWWMPAVALVTGCYLFVVSILPRRPLTAAAFAVAIFFTPLLQWFYTPSSVWPVAWALIAMAGIVWLVKDPRRWVRFSWSAVIGYCAVTMAMGLYVPFMVPCILLVIAFAVGYVFRARVWALEGTRAFLERLVPLLIAAVGSGSVVLAFVISHATAFNAIGSTVYPGNRAVPTGSLLASDPYLTGIGGAPWSQALKAGGSTLLGINSSEGSSAFVLCLFVLPGMIWFTVRSMRRGRPTDWLLVACTMCFVVLAADLLVPGWGAISRFLLLDLVPPERFRIFLVVALPVFATLVIEQIGEIPSRRNWVPALLSTLVGVVFTAYLVGRFVTSDPEVLKAAPTWVPITIALLAATYLLFVRGAAPWATLLLLVATVATTGNVNPVYRGLYDLRATHIGEQVLKVEKSSEGNWVGVGSYSTMAVLVETGVESFTGVQTYPPKEMWKDIDPSSKYEAVWNRLAHVQWTFGKGEPKLSNPQPDVVNGTFDACSGFAQKHVKYVLSDVKPPPSACLRQLSNTHQGTRDMWIYKVISR